MGEPKGKLVTPVADNPDDELRSLEVDALDNLKVNIQAQADPIEVVLAEIEVEWKDWTPTYSAANAMTWTSVTTNIAKYAQIGKIVFFILYASGTV
ncbi:unnamed protein product, partial [marine sediment metagenome]